MRILVVSNLYPPHYVGGYELGCRDVVEELRRRGHEVSVLTSTYGLDPAAPLAGETGVERLLYCQVGQTRGRHRKFHECRILARALRRHRPDIVYFWNQGGLSHWLPIAARWLGYRFVYFLSDPLFNSWRVAAFLARWCRPEFHTLRANVVRRVFGRTFLVRGWPVIQGQPCHFASAFLRGEAKKNGILIGEKLCAVIRWGIEASLYAGLPREARPVRRLLYVGQMIPQKGVHTAIAAVGRLAKEDSPAFTLTLAGGGLHPEYERQLREMPPQLGIADRVHFLGKVPRAELPAIYAQHDILVFPSEWDEPFAITPLEAMASGLVVVGTVTGGSGELFRDRETAMTFVAGDAVDCARAIRELTADRALYDAVQRRAFDGVTNGYTITSMVNAIETSLKEIVAGSSQSRRSS